MKKIIAYFILFFFFFLIHSAKAKAQTITPSPKITLNPASNNSFEILFELLKIIFNIDSQKKISSDQSNIILPSTFPDINPTPDVNGLVYYSQCQGPYDNYPLPQGGTVCQAGCGPTTVAMIVASYTDKNITPPKIVEEYKKNGYYLGPSGSYYTHAENVIKKYSLKTTYIFSDNRPRTVDQVMSNFGQIIKNYQNAGWTFFVLANFCDGGCGHYFWIIKIDDGLNIWAYDPAYDIKLPKPINHKKRYPFPKLRIIFGVKK